MSTFFSVKCENCLAVFVFFFEMLNIVFLHIEFCCISCDVCCVIVRLSGSGRGTHNRQVQYVVRYIVVICYHICIYVHSCMTALCVCLCVCVLPVIVYLSVCVSVQTTYRRASGSMSQGRLSPSQSLYVCVSVCLSVCVCLFRPPTVVRQVPCLRVVCLPVSWLKFFRSMCRVPPSVPS